MTELRQTLDSGKALADALHVLKPPAHPDRKPLDMKDVHAVVEQTTLAADGLNELVRSMDQALAPDDLEARLTRLDMALERAQLRGQRVVNRAFFLGATLVVIIFGLSVAMVLILRRLGPATK